MYLVINFTNLQLPIGKSSLWAPQILTPLVEGIGAPSDLNTTSAMFKRVVLYLGSTSIGWLSARRPLATRVVLILVMSLSVTQTHTHTH